MKTNFCFYDFVFNLKKSFVLGCPILVLIRIELKCIINNILTLQYIVKNSLKKNFELKFRIFIYIVKNSLIV